MDNGPASFHAFDFLADFVLVCRTDGRLHYANRAADVFFGEVLTPTLSLTDLGLPLHQDQLSQPMQTTTSWPLSGEKATRIHWRASSRNEESLIFWQGRAETPTPEESLQERPQESDVLDQKIWDDFSRIADGVGLGLAKFKHGEIQELSPKLRQWLLLHPETSWTPSPLEQWIHPSHQEKIRTWINHLLAGNAVQNPFPCDILDAQGREHPVELCFVSPTLNEHQESYLFFHPQPRHSVLDTFLYQTEWLDRIFSRFEDVLYAMTPDCTLVYVSPKIYDWFKLPKELTGRSFLEFIHGDDLETVLDDLQSCLVEGRPFLTTFHIEDSEGNIRLLEDQGIPFHQDGKPLLICGFLRDITSRESGPLQWKLQNQQLKLAMIGNELGYWDWNLQTDRIKLDKSWFARLGYSPDEVPQTMIEWSSWVHEEDLQIIAKRVTKHSQGLSDIHEAELRLRAKDGSWLWVRDRGKIIEWDSQGNPLRMIGTYWNIDQRKKVEESLRLREEQYRLLFDNIQDGVFMIRDGRLAIVNESLASLLGYSPEQMIDRPITDFISPNHLDKVLENHEKGKSRKHFNPDYETNLLHKNGTGVPVNIHVGTLHLEHGAFLEIGTIKDISERIKAEKETKRLHEELLQSQKMEAIGRLAGGVAHDFNNLLTGISGHASLCLMDISQNDPYYQSLKEIERAAERGTRLNRQLLTFTKKKLVNSQLMNLNELVREMDRMVSRLIPEDIQRSFQLQDDLWPILADRSQMEQVILNLVINARDAMPNGGRLVIRTKNLERGYRGDLFSSKNEPCVRLTIQDNGHGINKEILPHIFEPFFTTKSQSQGTGLGLSTVYGVIQQHGGHLDVESQVGDGTWMHIHLPRAEGKVPEAKQSSFFNHAAFTPTENVTILVVEDDDAVRQVVTQMLTRLSFHVLSAEDGEQALALSKEYDGVIDLLLTDVVMSGMNGRELAKQIVWQRPKIKILFTSGYSENLIAHKGVLDDGLNFLPKPYSTKSLLTKIREVLAQV